MEQIIKKPLNEYSLAKPFQRSMEGKKGFQKSKVPKTMTFTLRIDSNTMDFINEYCELWGITKTQLFLGSIQCYTGYDRTNGKKIIETIRKHILPKDKE